MWTGFDSDAVLHMSRIKCRNYYKSAIFFSHNTCFSVLISAELSLESGSNPAKINNLGWSKFEFDSAHVKYGV